MYYLSSLYISSTKHIWSWTFHLFYSLSPLGIGTEHNGIMDRKENLVFFKNHRMLPIDENLLWITVVEMLQFGSADMRHTREEGGTKSPQMKRLGEFTMVSQPIWLIGLSSIFVCLVLAELSSLQL